MANIYYDLTASYKNLGLDGGKKTKRHKYFLQISKCI